MKKNVIFYCFNFLLDQHFIERYNDYQNDLHDKNVKKLAQSENRHNTNMEKLNEENEKILKNNQDKAFKKYCSVVKYFYLKIHFSNNKFKNIVLA